MEEILEKGNLGKNILLNKEIDLDIYRKKEEYEKLLSNVINSGFEYAVKGLGLSDNFKKSLQEVKDILKKKDFKEIISDSVSASLKEGLNITKDNPLELKNLDKLKDNSIKGGLKFLLSAGLDIVINKLLKGNLFLPQIKKVIDSVKNFLQSNSFISKIDSGLKKIFNRKNNFKNACDNWYKSYENFNIKDINNYANILNKFKNSLKYDKECVQQNNIIQNMTKLINNKKDKLSQIQLQICSEL